MSRASRQSGGDSLLEETLVTLGKRKALNTYFQPYLVAD